MLHKKIEVYKFVFQRFIRVPRVNVSFKFKIESHQYFISSQAMKLQLLEFKGHLLIRKSILLWHWKPCFPNPLKKVKILNEMVIINASDKQPKT